MRQSSTVAALAAAVSSTILLAACGGGSGSGGTVAANGTVAVALTDAPACGFDEVNVTVAKVRIHKSDSADANDGGWTDITLDPARKINLVNLTNGALEELGEVDLPAGHYTQLRLVLAADNAGSGLANSVKPVNGAETKMATPSGIQSGIKLVGQFDVEAGAKSELVIDFDACRSVVTRGNGNYALKPVISLIRKATSGSISGYLDPALAGSHPVVNAELDGVIVKSTVPDANGYFKLSPLPQSAAGADYAVVVTADAHAAKVVNKVPVSAQADTPLSTSAEPLDLPASAMNTVSGTIDPADAMPTIAAGQSFSGGPTVTIAYANADASSGEYSISLPAAAPELAQYGSLPLSTSPVTSLAGKYSLTAAGTGVQPQTVNIDVSGGNVSKSFTLK
jgi:hypothetical protein